jgi:hypothetical protein
VAKGTRFIQAKKRQSKPKVVADNKNTPHKNRVEEVNQKID